MCARLTGMERLEWMYQLSWLSHSFICLFDTAWKHTLSVNRLGIICLCSYYKNKLVLEGGEVQSHLIKCGFVEKPTVLRFHSEQDDASDGASGGNSSSSMIVNVDHGVGPSSSLAGGTSLLARMLISSRWMILSKTWPTTGVTVMRTMSRPWWTGRMGSFLSNLLTALMMTFYFGSPRWPENFKEMKQLAKDLLYKDCPKQWMALRFDH